MSKLAHQPRVSISLPSAALVISLLASLGACAALDQSQQESTAPITRAAPAVQPSETFWGYSKAAVAQPTGPTFWGYSQAPAVPSSEPMFWGFANVPVAQPTGPTFWGYSKVPAERPIAAVPPSREPKTPVAVQR